MKTNLSLLRLMVILVVLVGGCTENKPALTTFLPPEGSPFKITFSYPAEWKWTYPPQPSPHEYQIIIADIYSDSRKAEILISIDVYVVSSPESEMSHDIELFLKTKTTLPQFKILEDKSVLIDGHEARWFVTRTSDIGRDRPSIAEDIFLLAKDRVYEIGIHYTENETNQDFHEEFLAMIASIKFLP